MRAFIARRRRRADPDDTAVGPTNEFTWRNASPRDRRRASVVVLVIGLCISGQALFLTAALIRMAPAAALIIVQMDTVIVAIWSLLRREDRGSVRKMFLTAGVLAGAAVTLAVGGLHPLTWMGIALAGIAMFASAGRQMLMPIATVSLKVNPANVLLPANVIGVIVGASTLVAMGGISALAVSNLTSLVELIGVTVIAGGATWGFYAALKYVAPPKRGVQPVGTVSPWDNSALLTLQVPAAAGLGLFVGEAVPLIGGLGILVTTTSMALLAAATTRTNPGLD